MNIFEIFCDGDGRINETNMSSVLGFLLSPEGAHGYKRSFLGCFLAPIQSNLERLDCWQNIKPRNRLPNIRQAINAFSRIQIELEENVTPPSHLPAVGAAKPRNTGKRDIDLTIRLFLPNDQLRLVIAIENKIRNTSGSDEMQLNDEYRLLRQKINVEAAEYDNANARHVPLIFIYLTDEKVSTSKSQLLRKQWESLNLPVDNTIDQTDFKVNYYWKPDIDILAHGNQDASITAFALLILGMEQRGEINPASSHSTLLLRSLIKFIDNDFGPDSEKYGAESGYSDMLEVELGDFWATWPERRIRAKNLATRIFYELGDAIQINHAQSLQDAELGYAYRPVKTRITIFLNEVDNPAETDVRKLRNVLARIHMEGNTTNSALHLEFTRRSTVTSAEIFSHLPPNAQATCDELSFVDHPDKNRYDMFVPVTVDFEQFRVILKVAVDEAVRNVLG